MNPRPTYEELKRRVEQLKAELNKRNVTQEALLESEEKCRTILAGIEDGYFETDLSGHLRFFNPPLCKVLGYSKEELTGMNYRQFMTEETAGKAFETFKEVFQTGKSAQVCDWETVGKDGSSRFFETSVSLLHDARGVPIGFRGIARDITERKEAEEQARVHQQQLFQASKMVSLGTLVSGVAHEINNPNNFIMLNTPLLIEAWESAMPILEEYYEKNGDFLLGGMSYTEMREHIGTLFSGILDGAKRIQQIVEELRNYIRKDNHDLSQTVDFNLVVRSAVSLVSNMIKKSTNRFSVDYDSGLPPIKGNFQRLEQVVINLIQNACQALPGAHKAISVSTSKDAAGENILFTVRDEGTGILPENLAYVTDPFFTTKHDSGGTGLGLAISSKIVQQHGGNMTFTSEHKKGTTVEVTFPFA